MRYLYLLTAFGVVLVVSIFGFRGSQFTSPPIDVFPEWAFPGMKYQPRFRPQSENPFFADGRADRPLPANVVPASVPLRDNSFIYTGRDAAGDFAAGFPASLELDEAFLERGQQRYSIYCAPCHGELGDGNGVVKRYGVAAVTFHDDRRRGFTEGEIYSIITNGSASGLMLSYADKLVPDDRWAVIAYVRALQRTQLGTPADVTDAATRQTLGLQ